LPAPLRHHLSDPWRIRLASGWAPVRYVLFDLLYHRGRSWLAEPWVRRREALAAACAELAVLFSEAVLGRGRALYEAVLAQGYEGVMAKHVTAPYKISFQVSF
jgi:bifunctional non-homologous end joining protein LigD